MVDNDERRRAQRFPLDLPMEVKWQEETEVIQKLASIRDISASGVYFTVDREVRPESKIEFYVQLQMEGAEKGGVLCTALGASSALNRTRMNPSARAWPLASIATASCDRAKVRWKPRRKKNAPNCFWFLHAFAPPR